MSEEKTRGRPRGFGDEPKECKNRFQKFYYENRERINNERRERYNYLKAQGLCVRCGKKAKAGVLCEAHRKRAEKE